MDSTSRNEEKYRILDSTLEGNCGFFFLENTIAIVPIVDTILTLVVET